MEGIIKGIIFLGPPGAGKGTQAQILSQTIDFVKLSTGDILRESVNKKTSLGLKAHEYMKKGELVPDEIMLDLIKETLNHLRETTKGFILDGFPRTIQQARGLDKILEELNMTILKVILLDLEDQEIVNRLSNRRICPTCQATYNLITNPPKHDNLCDNDNTPLIIRDDDKPETILNRLKVYRDQTQPLIEYYKQKNLLVEINGKGNPQEIFQKILQSLQL